MHPCSQVHAAPAAIGCAWSEQVRAGALCSAGLRLAQASLVGLGQGPGPLPCPCRTQLPPSLAARGSRERGRSRGHRSGWSRGDQGRAGAAQRAAGRGAGGQGGDPPTTQGAAIREGCGRAQRRQSPIPSTQPHSSSPKASGDPSAGGSQSSAAAVPQEEPQGPPARGQPPAFSPCAQQGPPVPQQSPSKGGGHGQGP